MGRDATVSHNQNKWCLIRTPHAQYYCSTFFLLLSERPSILSLQCLCSCDVLKAIGAFGGVVGYTPLDHSLSEREMGEFFLPDAHTEPYSTHHIARPSRFLLAFITLVMVFLGSIQPGCMEHHIGQCIEPVLKAIIHAFGECAASDHCMHTAKGSFFVYHSTTDRSAIPAFSRHSMQTHTQIFLLSFHTPEHQVFRKVENRDFPSLHGLTLVRES